MIDYFRHTLELPSRWFVLAAMGTVLCFASFLLLYVSPILILFSIIPMIFSPFFLVLTTWRYGLRMGVAVTGVVSVFLLMLLHLPALVYYLAQFAVVGICLGEGLRRKTPFLRLLVSTSLISTLIIVGIGVFLYLHDPETVTKMVTQGSEDLQLALKENAQRFNLDPKELMRYQDSTTALIGFVKRSFPALLFINAFSIVYLNFLLPLHLGGKLGLDASHIPSFKEVSMPFFWIWGLIVSGMLYLLKIPYLKWVGLNVALIFLLAYLMQGYAILSFYLSRTRLPKLLKGMIYLACLMSVPLIITLCGVGLFDTWFNFRERSAVKSD